MTAPRYVVYVLLDEPQGNKSTWGFASGGWTAAPTAGRIVERVAPLMKVEPVNAEAPDVRRAMAIEVNTRGPKLASY
jgi:cell division protein FtsI (penicillin-binding protein 3)